MKIAQHFSAGWEPGSVNKSVKRTTERYRAAGFGLSRPLRGLYESLCPWIPPMNRWAIVIRRLRRLLQQSRPGAKTRRSGNPRERGLTVVSNLLEKATLRANILAGRI